VKQLACHSQFALFVSLGSYLDEIIPPNPK